VVELLLDPRVAVRSQRCGLRALSALALLTLLALSGALLLDRLAPLRTQLIPPVAAALACVLGVVCVQVAGPSVGRRDRRPGVLVLRPGARRPSRGLVVPVVLVVLVGRVDRGFGDFVPGRQQRLAFG